MRVSIMKYVFIAFGAVFIAVAVTTANHTRTFVSHARTAHGTVIDLVRHRSSNSNAYAPEVRFVTADGQFVQFTSTISSAPPSYATGEAVDVLYRPLAPVDARIASFTSLWADTLMFGAMGSIFFLVSTGIMLSAIGKARRAAELKRHGNRLLTTVARIEHVEKLRVNGRNPYRVFTQWTSASTPETRVFGSDYIWFDPSPYLKGREIPVFVERTNPSSYFVDLSFLPKPTQSGHGSRLIV